MKKELNVCASVFFLYDCWWFDKKETLPGPRPRPLQKNGFKNEKLIIKQKRHKKHKVFSKVQIIIFHVLAHPNFLPIAYR